MKAEVYHFDHLPLSRLRSYIFQNVGGRPLTAIYHSHDFYEIIWQWRGRTEKTVNGEAVALAAGQALLLRPGDAHVFSFQSEDATVISLSVRGEELEHVAAIYAPGLVGYITAAAQPIPFSLPSGECPLCETEFDCKHLLSFFLHAYITAFGFSEAPPMPTPMLLTLAEKMRERENLRRGIAAATAISHYSQCHLARLVRAQLGMGLKEWINSLRLTVAEEELLLTRKPIPLIAEEVGFSSLSHFSKLFKERFGVTPAAMRRKRRLLTV